MTHTEIQDLQYDVMFTSGIMSH